MRINSHTGAGYISIRQAATEPDRLEIYFYGDIEGGWTDYFGDYHEGNGCDKLREELESRPNVSQIDIYINSYGGDVFEGTAIYNLLKRHPAKKTVYVDGFACSIASVIAMAGDEVVMPPNTLMLVHNMWTVATGNARELRKVADDLDVINEAGRQAYLLKAGDKLREETLIELMEAETWLSAARCVELGLADRMTDAEADMSSAEDMLREENKGLSERLRRREKTAARLRELAAGGAPKEPEPKEPEPKEPEPKEPEPKELNLLIRTLSGT